MTGWGAIGTPVGLPVDGASLLHRRLAPIVITKVGFACRKGQPRAAFLVNFVIPIGLGVVIDVVLFHLSIMGLGYGC